MFVVCVEAIIHLLLYKLHDCTFNTEMDLRMYHVVDGYQPFNA